MYFVHRLHHQLKNALENLFSHCFVFLFQEFFLNVKDILRRSLNDEKPESLFQLWTKASNDLQQKFSEAKNSIHLALCDNIDTRTVLDIIRDLVGICNVYVRDHSSDNTLNILLLKRIAAYITDILHIFGVISGPRGGIGFPIESGKTGDSTLEDQVSCTRIIIKLQCCCMEINVFCFCFFLFWGDFVLRHKRFCFCDDISRAWALKSQRKS